MTNHSETTGSFENDSYPHLFGPFGPDDRPAHQVTLRTPAELADALPYLLGYRPEDSIVLVALYDHGGRGRFGGRARIGIPRNPEDWSSVARQMVDGLIIGSRRRGAPPEQMVAYLCQEPAPGQTGRQVMERLQPLAHALRLRSGELDVPVVEALCISDGRYWSYICEREACCPSEGAPMGLPGTSVLAAAAAYAGVRIRGTLRELRARLLPWETSAALQQEVALDTTSMALVPRIVDGTGRVRVAEETVGLAGQVVRRFAEAPAVSGMLDADRRDDELLSHEEAAALILGLQDRTTRDRLAEWMEGDEAEPALRLWRALARRCVGPYGEHAAAPLTLVGWVAWSIGDEVEAREALAMALGADPGYLFARLLHQAINEGLDPESVRRCLRAEREGRTRATTQAGRTDTGEGRRDGSDIQHADPDGERQVGVNAERVATAGGCQVGRDAERADAGGLRQGDVDAEHADGGEGRRRGADAQRATMGQEHRNGLDVQGPDDPSVVERSGGSAAADADRPLPEAAPALASGLRTTERRRRTGPGHGRAGTGPRPSRPAGARPRTAGKLPSRRRSTGSDGILPTGAEAEEEA
ncbi:DUF4192 family protein [Streptomyces sp. NPDC014802]|uniref:DUF4192 family protein n=1 Tax=Streptomyces sp. NPDC014802 TaxID=3364917 RepID=UPI0036F92BD8